MQVSVSADSGLDPHVRLMAKHASVHVCWYALTIHVWPRAPQTASTAGAAGGVMGGGGNEGGGGVAGGEGVGGDPGGGAMGGGGGRSG